MASAELESARWKLGRARTHLADLQAACVDLTLDPKHHRAFVEYDSHEGCHVMWFDDLPSKHGKEAALIAGDLVHCARSALDHAAWRLAVKHLGRWPTEKEARVIQFPILTVDNWANAADLRAFFSTDAADALAEFQLPERPDRFELPLARLGRLSIEDKHRALLPTRDHTTTKYDFVIPDGIALVRRETMLANDQIAWLVRRGYLYDIGNGTLAGPETDHRIMAAERLYFEPEAEARTAEIEVHPERTINVAFSSTFGSVAPYDFVAIVEKVGEVIDRLNRLF